MPTPVSKTKANKGSQLRRRKHLDLDLYNSLALTLVPKTMANEGTNCEEEDTLRTLTSTLTVVEDNNYVRGNCGAAL
jgi:hypothetical protein